jgi:prepilin-type N-terminal cleavage/methylation domain-containing protein
MKNSKGFTLIEVMIVVVIAAAIIGAITKFQNMRTEANIKYLEQNCSLDNKTATVQQTIFRSEITTARHNLRSTGVVHCPVGQPSISTSKPKQLTPAKINAVAIEEHALKLTEIQSQITELVQGQDVFNTEYENNIAKIQQTMQQIIDNGDATQQEIANLNANIQQVQANKASQDAATAEVLQNLANIYAPPSPVVEIINSGDAQNSSNEVDDTTTNSTIDNSTSIN